MLVVGSFTELCVPFTQCDVCLIERLGHAGDRGVEDGELLTVVVALVYELLDRAAHQMLLLAQRVQLVVGSRWRAW